MSEAAIPVSPLAGGRLAAHVSSDERLARRAAAGDQRAFAAIFRRYHQDLYRYCLAILRNPDDAQDALQGTMVKALQALPGEQRQIDLKPWLYRIAHNESIDLVRRRHGSESLPAELAAPGPDLAGEAETRQRLQALLADLETLPERQRGALVMRELAGLDFAEIGAALGTSPAVARQTVYEARLGLRQIESGREMRCDAVTKTLSEADGRVRRRRDIRAHLRACSDCRRFGEEINGRSRDLAALAPLPALAAGGLLQGIFGGQTAGGGLAGALGAGTAKTLGASTALKATATVAVVAAIGTGAAQRADLIHVGLPGDGGHNGSKSAPASGGEPGTRAAPARATPAPATDPPAGSAARLDDRSAVREATGSAKRVGEGRAAVAETPAAAPTVRSLPAQAKGKAKGKGSRPALPEAASHGQQTAAAHKNSNRGGEAKSSNPPKPPKPTHPTHSAAPAKQTPTAKPLPGSAGQEKANPGGQSSGDVASPTTPEG